MRMAWFLPNTQVFPVEIWCTMHHFEHEKMVQFLRVIKSATEAASMILRIDDVIASSKSGGAPAMPQGDMGMQERFLKIREVCVTH